MGRLFDVKTKIEAHLREKKLPESRTKGALCLKSGVLLALVRPDTPDDSVKLHRLRVAVREILKIEL
jgi:hypothetical protein